MSMTLGALHARLDALLRDGVSPDALVIVEGYTEDERFIQAGVDSADVGEPLGVYLDLVEATVDE